MSKHRHSNVPVTACTTQAIVTQEGPHATRQQTLGKKQQKSHIYTSLRSKIFLFFFFLLQSLKQMRFPVTPFCLV